MKTFTFLVSFLFTITALQAQNYQISFTGSGQSTTIDSIRVENLSQGTTLSLAGDDILNLVAPIGINTRIANEGNEKIYPNPMVESTIVEFDNSKTELVSLEIFNEMGILMATQSTLVQQGRQRFKISGLNAGIYNVIVSTAHWNYTAKLISMGETLGSTTITHQGTHKVSSPKNAIKSTKELVEMEYNDGEIILFKGFSDVYTHVLTLLPTESQTVNFEFIACSDEDGNNYAVVIIGTQTWMAENLNYETTNSWEYDDNSANGDIYGRLYTWDAALTSCPNGWHLPSDDEFKTLEMELGMSQSQADATGWRGTDEGGKMKETGEAHWLSPNTGATNSSGFTALPGGFRTADGTFRFLDNYNYYWLATADGSLLAWTRYLKNVYGEVYRYSNAVNLGLSVRCLRD